MARALKRSEFYGPGHGHYGLDGIVEVRKVGPATSWTAAQYLLAGGIFRDDGITIDGVEYTVQEVMSNLREDFFEAVMRSDKIGLSFTCLEWNWLTKCWAMNVDPDNPNALTYDQVNSGLQMNLGRSQHRPEYEFKISWYCWDNEERDTDGTEENVFTLYRARFVHPVPIPLKAEDWATFKFQIEGIPDWDNQSGDLGKWFTDDITAAVTITAGDSCATTYVVDNDSVIDGYADNALKGWIYFYTDDQTALTADPLRPIYSNTADEDKITFIRAYAEAPAENKTGLLIKGDG